MGSNKINGKRDENQWGKRFRSQLEIDWNTENLGLSKKEGGNENDRFEIQNRIYIKPVEDMRLF